MPMGGILEKLSSKKQLSRHLIEKDSFKLKRI